jgi:hypothetical protein
MYLNWKHEISLSDITLTLGILGNKLLRWMVGLTTEYVTNRRLQNIQTRRPTHDLAKVKFRPVTVHLVPEVAWSHSSGLSLISARGGGGWSTPRPSRITPRERERRYLPHRRLSGPQGRSGLVLKTSPSSEFDPRTVQPIVNRYTDWAIAAHTPCFSRMTNGREMSLAWHL